ncbi:MAG: VOC family protein [Proteobacteria bacterium]|nr:VOC family protein [Pseudomonadota bacterium]
MMITGLFHIAIKTANLPATVKFYTEVVGLAEFNRPNFGFPGAWLGTAGPAGFPIIHIYAGGPALGGRKTVAQGTAAIDHVSLSAVGFHDFVKRFKKYDLDWREFEVPGTTLWQLFVYDPSGVQLEITFDAKNEHGRKPDMSKGRAYEAGSTFFDPARYGGLLKAA